MLEQASSWCHASASAVDYLQGNPVTLTARTRPGFSFGGWSDGVSTPTRTVDLSADLGLVACGAGNQSLLYDLESGMLVQAGPAA